MRHSHSRGHVAALRAVVCTTAFALISLLAPSSFADEITVKGDRLRGAVTAVTGKAIEFKTEYGKGSLSVPIGDIESIACDTEFYFVYGDKASARGKLLGIRDGAFVVGTDDATAVRVPASDVHEVYDAGVMDGATGWLREATALWHGSFDLGYSLTQSTLDTSGVTVGFNADRKKKPSRITFNASYRYSTNETRVDDPNNPGQTKKEEDTSENEAKGLLRGEYDVMPKVYWYGSQDAEYDEIERLSYRLVPKTGLGYRFWETDDGLFQLEAGGAYVYENFFGSDDNGFFAISFGKLLEWKMPWLGSEFMWRTDYLPAVDDWGNDYLIRSEAALLVPMIKWLKFRIGVSETYDSTPAEDADKNTLATTAGLAAVY
jgi:putative salt-induced outer membrane protein YdiY